MSTVFSSTSQATGIIVDSLNTSSLLYEITKLNSDPQLPFCLFYMNNGLNSYNFTVGVFPLLSLHYMRAYPQYGTPTLIATSLESAKLLINLGQKVNKIFYLYGLEWYNNDARKNYDTNIKILKHPELTIFTRHQTYQEAVKKYAGLDIEVKTLQEIIDHDYE